MNTIIDEIIKAATSKSYLDLQSYYNSPNIFEELNIKRREVELHSAFLRWFLDPNSNHGLGQQPLKLFLQSAAKAKYELKNEKATLEPAFCEAFLLNAYTIKSVDVTAETVTKEYAKDPQKRVDILIELTATFAGETKVLPIIIENKVKSKEGKDQTQTYKNWADIKYSDKTIYFSPVFIFLKPDFLKDPPKCKDYVSLSYQELSDLCIEKCLALSPTPFGELFIRQYLRSLSVSDIGQLKETNEVMAMTKEERALLKRFYEEHESLILAVIEAYKNDDDTPPEERDKLSEAADIMRSTSTKNEKFLFDGVARKKGPTVVAVVKDYISKHPDITENDLRKAFPDSIRNSKHENATGGVIKNYSDANIVKDRYSDPVTLKDGTQIGISPQYIPETFKKFTEAAKQLGYDIKRAQ